jgi:hypothetical protein
MAVVRHRDFSVAEVNYIFDLWAGSNMMRGNYCVDAYGSVIRKASYKTQGAYGWELDHIRPIANGGTHDIGNLRPLYWEHYVAKCYQQKFVPKKCGISLDEHIKLSST